MRIWIFNNYNMLPEQGGLNRHYYFAKALKKMGHEPVVFVGSHPHNTNLQMITGKEKYVVDNTHGFPWVYVKTYNYSSSKQKRMLAMFQYYINARKAAEFFSPPDVIIGSSTHPLATVLGINLGKKYKCNAIAEVRDLWPESFVAYGITKKNNPAVVAMRCLEKWIYIHADGLIFTMEGAYDYIVEQRWEKQIPREKVHYINNGVDLDMFKFNKAHFQIDDADLKDPKSFKVIYTGSVRRVNNLGLLLDAAKEVQDTRVKFLIWGDGDERQMLEQRIEDENISNVAFKGKVEKKYIPYIVSCADVNFAHNTASPIFRFGISFNKLFDYLAAGKPILCDFPCNYNPVVQCGAGNDVSNPTSSEIAKAIDEMVSMPLEQKKEMCRCAESAAMEYSFEKLARRLQNIIEHKSI